MKLEVYNSVNLKEQPIHAEEEVRVSSEMQVGFDGFCHQMSLLKFLGIQNEHNRKKEEKGGKDIVEGKFCNRVHV